MLDTVTVKAGMTGVDTSAKKLKVKQAKDQEFAQFLFPLTIQKQVSKPEDEQSLSDILPNIAALCSPATSIRCDADIQIHESVTTNGNNVLTTDATELCSTTLPENNQLLPKEVLGIAVQLTNNDTISRLNTQSSMQYDGVTLTGTDNFVVESEMHLPEQNVSGSSQNFEFSILDNSLSINTDIKHQQIHNTQSRETGQIKSAEASTVSALEQDNQHNNVLTPMQVAKVENPKQAKVAHTENSIMSGNQTDENEKQFFDYHFQLEKKSNPNKSKIEIADSNHLFTQEKSVFETVRAEVYSGKENSVTTAIKNKPVVMQITDSIANNELNEKTRFTMDLWPEELGRVTVDMEYTGGKLSLSLIAEKAGTSKLLSENIAQLKYELSDRQMDVTNVDVQTGSSNTFTDLNKGYRQHGNDNTANVRYTDEYVQGGDIDLNIEIMQQFIKGKQLLNYLI